MAERNLVLTTYQGKSLEEIHAEMRNNILDRQTPVRLEDVMTDLGYDDVFAREVIKRSFAQTLKEGGANADLTEQKKWLDRGKIMDYDRKTVPAVALSISSSKMVLSDQTREAVSNIVQNLNSRAGRKLDSATVGFIAEDVGTILSDNEHLRREAEIHQQYHQQTEKALTMMADLIAKLPGGSNSQSAPARR